MIGENLRTIRKLKGITLKELASMLNVSEQSISQYERSVRKISMDKLYKIAKALDVEITDLTGKAKEEVVSNNLAENLRTIRKLKCISLDELSKLTGIAKTTIHGIEKGSNPSKDKLDKIAKALNIEIEELINYDSKNILENEISEEGQEILRELDKIKEKVYKHFRKE